MSTRPSAPEPAEDQDRHGPQPAAGNEEPGSAVEHEPDPDAEPLPDGKHKHVPRSPYTTGNW